MKSEEKYAHIKGINYAVRYRDKRFYIEEICLKEKDAMQLALFFIECIYKKKTRNDK